MWNTFHIYQFRVEVLQPSAPGPERLPLPVSPKQVRPLLGQLDTHPEADLLATQVRGPRCASWACPDGVRLSHPLRRTRSIRSNPISCCVQNRETRAGVPVSRHSGHR